MSENAADEVIGPVPVLAVVGRPNVGKSTLVNRIIGRREAVVEDVPGVTRDRVSYDANWAGRAFTVVDTGGWDPDARGMAASIRAQAEVAVTLADAVLFVVDAAVGITDDDEAVVRILRKSGKPVVLAANKVDDQRAEAEAYALWNLGLGEPYPVSALHGRGSGDLLDAVLEALPEPPPERDAEVGGPRRIAIVGKPNVGKSSLLNKVAGQERVVVDNVAGTTVDPVDELVDLGGRTWRFIDTAGIRKRVKEASGHEYYASLRTTTAIDRAEVAVLVLDASQSISEQDQRIVQTIREAGRALVIAFNKWDLVDEERRYYLDREIERELVQVQWAPRINVTAKTGWHVDRLVPALDKALEGWETRVGTGTLNAFLGRLVAEHPHPVRGGKQPKIMFGTQPATSPPTFVLFTSGKLEASYERYIERRLREEFGFVGTPIVLQQRVREKRRSARVAVGRFAPTSCGRWRSSSPDPRTLALPLVSRPRRLAPPPAPTQRDGTLIKYHGTEPGGHLPLGSRPAAWRAAGVPRSSRRPSCTILDPDLGHTAGLQGAPRSRSQPAHRRVRLGHLRHPAAAHCATGGGYAAIWAVRHGEWKEVLGTQDVVACTGSRGSTSPVRARSARVLRGRRSAVAAYDPP